VGTEKRDRQKANRQARLAELQREQRRTNTKKRALRISIIVVVALAAAFGLSRLIGTGGGESVSASDSTVGTAPASDTSVASTPPTVPGKTITGATPCPAADGSTPRASKLEQAPPMCIDPAKTYTALIETNKGPITVALDPKAAPKTVNNFVVLSRYHFFDNVVCHRIIDNFVVQCGDPEGTGSGGPGYTFEDELPAGQTPYKAGSLAMANSGANTNGSQFFIVTSDDGGKRLQPNYSLFGQVTSGMEDTVAALNAAAGPDASASNPAGGTPTKEPVYIKSVTITES
jgi:cyclophilin family peptidyl-prolyl cis-trans isomerase